MSDYMDPDTVAKQGSADVIESLNELSMQHIYRLDQLEIAEPSAWFHKGGA